MTAPVGEGHAISSNIYRHSHPHPQAKPDICIVLFTYFSIKFGGNSRRIDDDDDDDVVDGGGGVAGDIGMHKIYRLRLSQRLEAFKNDMSESRVLLLSCPTLVLS